MKKLSKSRAQALYIEWYLNRMHFSHRMFQRICKKLRETENLTTQKSKRRKRVCHEDNEINVLATVNGNPQISSRQIERESGIKRSIFLLNINTIHVVTFTKVYTVRILKIVLYFVSGCSIKCTLTMNFCH